MRGISDKHELKKQKNLNDFFRDTRVLILVPSLALAPAPARAAKHFSKFSSR